MHTRKKETKKHTETRHLEGEGRLRIIDEDNLTVEMSFSSTIEVERWFGLEVLGHEKTNVRLGRLNGGAALLLNHDSNAQIGVVESARIDDSATGRATVRFSRGKLGEEIFRDVQDGIRRLVSVGYLIHKESTEQLPGGVERVTVTDWEPYELSIVSVPADDSVGVGRNHDNNNPENYKEMIDKEKKAGESKEKKKSIENDALETRSLQEKEKEREADKKDDIKRDSETQIETRRVDAIEAIAERAKNHKVDFDITRALDDGTPAEMVEKRFIQKVLNERMKKGEIYAPAPSSSETSRNEKSGLDKFSIARGIQCLMDNKPLDGVEREMNEEGQREMSQCSEGYRGNFVVPSVALAHGRRRDMTGTGGSGGNQGGTTIATDLGSFIDLLYSRMVLRGLGAQFLTGLTGNFDLPKMVTGSSATHKAENTAADESSPTTGKISFAPKRLPTYIEVSKQLLRQSSVSIESILRNDLATALALGMEDGAINGTGSSNQPTGVLATTGIGSVAGGTNGASPDWNDIVDLETAVSTANADIGNLAYLTNPKVRGQLKKSFVDTSSNAERVWNSMSGNTPLNGYKGEVTTQIPDNLTKGTATGVASAILFGNWADLVVAQWGGIDINVNPYVKDIEGLVRITADVYYDSAVRRAQSFSAMKDALTT